jgi:hypothetical protein
MKMKNETSRKDLEGAEITFSYAMNEAREVFGAAQAEYERAVERALEAETPASARRALLNASMAFSKALIERDFAASRAHAAYADALVAYTFA